MRFIRGMMGMGDTIHSRAVVKYHASQGGVVLETPWPCFFYDIDNVQFVKPNTQLRTQNKNIERESDKYISEYSRERRIVITYDYQSVKWHGGFFKAMCAMSGLPRNHGIPFALLENHDWTAKAKKWLDLWKPDKPLMIYRPLVERTEWNGCASRNPDKAAYVELAKSFKDQFFIVSIADLKAGIEWQVSESIGVDVECHHGELDAETLAALYFHASLVYCSPGFSLIMAQATKAPMVCVFGGHESARLYSHGWDYNCFIEPVNPCECFSKTHNCDKRIDIEQAKLKIGAFLESQSTIIKDRAEKVRHLRTASTVL